MIPRSSDAPGALNWAFLLLLSLVWGTAFMSVRIALDGIGPMWVAALRTLVAAVILAVVGQAMGQGLGAIPSRRALRYIAAFGFFAAALPFGLLSWGQQHVPSGFAGVSMGAVPLLTLLFAALFTAEEGIGPRRIAGIALGFLGLMALVGPGALDGTGPLFQMGRIACVAAAVCYGTANIIGRLAPPVPPIALASGAMAAAAIVMVPVALAVEGPPRIAATGPALAMLWVAIGPTALAAFLQVRLLQSAGPLFLGLVSYLVPIWAVAFGIALMSETLSAGTFLALALIIAGIAVAQSRPLADWLRRRSTDAS